MQGPHRERFTFLDPALMRRHEDPMSFLRELTQRRQESRGAESTVRCYSWLIFCNAHVMLFFFFPFDIQRRHRHSTHGPPELRHARVPHQSPESREMREARRAERARARAREREREVDNMERAMLEEAMRQSLMYVDEDGNPRSPQAVESPPVRDARVRKFLPQSYLVVSAHVVCDR